MSDRTDAPPDDDHHCPYRTLYVDKIIERKRAEARIEELEADVVLLVDLLRETGGIIQQDEGPYWMSVDEQVPLWHFNRAAAVRRLLTPEDGEQE